MQIAISLLVALVGLVVCLVSSNGDAKRLAGYAFLAGLLAFLLNGIPNIGIVAK